MQVKTYSISLILGLPVCIDCSCKFLSCYFSCDVLLHVVSKCASVIGWKVCKCANEVAMQKIADIDEYPVITGKYFDDYENYENIIVV